MLPLNIATIIHCLYPTNSVCVLVFHRSCCWCITEDRSWCVCVQWWGIFMDSGMICTTYISHCSIISLVKVRKQRSSKCYWIKKQIEHFHIGLH